MHYRELGAHPDGAYIMFRSNRGLTLAEVLVIVVVLFIVGAVLSPMLAPRHITCTASYCTSNMQQIGKAIKQYLADWDYTYPTNRCWVSRGKLGPVRDRVKLSPAEVDDRGNPIRFRHGVNWVEGLYGHIQGITNSKDASSVWCCPSASGRTYPAGSDSAAVSYAFNRNLAEKPENVIRGASNLLLVREMDRRVDAVLRPANDSTGDSAAQPASPFLTTRDCKLGKTKPDLHANGSNVLLADGHIRYFERPYFPDRYAREDCWDSETQQWYNYGPGAAREMPAKYIRSIAITP